MMAVVSGHQYPADALNVVLELEHLFAFFSIDRSLERCGG